MAGITATAALEKYIMLRPESSPTLARTIDSLLSEFRRHDRGSFTGWTSATGCFHGSCPGVQVATRHGAWMSTLRNPCPSSVPGRRQLQSFGWSCRIGLRLFQPGHVQGTGVCLRRSGAAREGEMGEASPLWVKDS